MTSNFFNFNHGIDQPTMRSPHSHTVNTDSYSNQYYYTSTVPTSTTSTMFSQGYVEWYWVALGLVVPVLLGSLFCILDHVRRKKTIREKHTEQRLESMCERNKYVPPSYEDVIPNDIVIEPVPDYPTQVPPPQHNTQQELPIHLPIVTISSEINQGSASLEAYQATPAVMDSYLSPRDQLTSSDAMSVTSGASSYYNDDELDSDMDVAEAPPSYDDYHKYELYGSTTQLV